MKYVDFLDRIDRIPAGTKNWYLHVLRCKKQSMDIISWPTRTEAEEFTRKEYRKFQMWSVKDWDFTFYGK